MAIRREARDAGAPRGTGLVILGYLVRWPKVILIVSGHEVDRRQLGSPRSQAPVSPKGLGARWPLLHAPGAVGAAAHRSRERGRVRREAITLCCLSRAERSGELRAGPGERAAGEYAFPVPW